MIERWNLVLELAALEENHLRRSLRQLDSPQGTKVQVDGRDLINFSSNDYLGLSGHERVKNAMIDGITRYGAGSGASRLVCGTLRPHHVLEEHLADFKGTEAALTFSSGYAVALGTIPALVGSNDVIILDKLCHASLVDAARLSGATIRVFPHNHLEKLAKLLATSQGRRTLVVTESIFSMDGDAALLREIVDLKDQHGAWLLLDEAHAVGVLGPQGRGLAASLGLDGRIDLHMGTLSKAFGLSGGYLAASRATIDLLINRARSFIYSTAPSPAIAHAASTALEVIRSIEGDTLRAQLLELIGRLLDHDLPGLVQRDIPSAILPVIVGDEDRAMQLSTRLRELGFLIPAIRYPTVARGSARLRITLSASHTREQVDALAACLTSRGNKKEEP
ncbi:MAG: 8-amino-7-oxononanoate synthase [Verrucomicrobiaceae bacterium]|nr:8-amino-7-oxononanoate synthase [Verrucomicrobiaceae bacterium]